jgi:hypothetical protein
MGFLPAIPAAVASLWAAPTATAAATTAAAAGSASAAAAPLTLSNLGLLGGAVTATPEMGAAATVAQAGAAAGGAAVANAAASGSAAQPTSGGVFSAANLQKAATLSTLASGGLAVAGALKGVPKPPQATPPNPLTSSLGPTGTNSSLAAQSSGSFLSGTFGGPQGRSPTAAKTLLGQ